MIKLTMTPTEEAYRKDSTIVVEGATFLECSINLLKALTDRIDPGDDSPFLTEILEALAYLSKGEEEEVRQWDFSSPDDGFILCIGEFHCCSTCGSRTDEPEILCEGCLEESEYE